MVTIEDVMRSVNNFFPIKGASVEGLWRVESGTLQDVPFLKEGQYFRIQGSIFNDGVYRYPEDVLYDEEFRGVVTPLAPPRSFIDLCDEISEWSETNKVGGKYQSESFAGYSYTLATNADGSTTTWRDAFRAMLSRWRKI